MESFVWALLGIGGLILIVFVILFNTMIARRNQVDASFSGMDVQLRKRHDLIPNLVNAVKGYMEHEKTVLERVTELRAKIVSSQLSDQQRFSAETQLTDALGRLFAVSENYPQLKASEHFMHLQKTLNEIEEQISAARRAYNASVMDFNNGVEMFPYNIVSRMMNLEKRDYFEANIGEAVAPNVGRTLSE